MFNTLLEDKIRFGFLSYKGLQGSSETDPACAIMTAVPPALANYTAIDTVYAAVGAGYSQQSPTPQKWQTPTNYAIGYAANLLAQDDFMGPKYILLVTDGNPNTCETVAPKCGQDRAVKAAQDAYAAGVGLLVLGVGDVVSNPNSGCADSDRCGLLHLQDLANAGIGAAVTAPPNCDDPSSTSCSAKYDSCNMGALVGSYTSGAPDVGTPFAVETTGPSAQSEVIAALSTLLDGIAPCSFDFDAAIDAPPATVDVEVGGSRRAYGDANGWLLSVDRHRLTLQGSACTESRNGASFAISTPCD